MSVSMSILAILDEGPSYGFRLKTEFESRTASVWPLNVGQVYTTLARLERDGYVAQAGEDGEKLYEITPSGRERLREWFAEPSERRDPVRDETVLKIVMAAARGEAETARVIQAERKATVRQLQDFTRLKRDGEGRDIGWEFLLDSVIFQAESRVRWLDACEERLRRQRPARRSAAGQPSQRRQEARA